MWYGYVSERYAATSRDVCTQLTVICSSLWYAAHCDMQLTVISLWYVSFTQCIILRWNDSRLLYVTHRLFDRPKGFQAARQKRGCVNKREGVSTKERVCQAARQKRGCVNTWNGLNYSIETTVLTHYLALSHKRARSCCILHILFLLLALFLSPSLTTSLNPKLPPSLFAFRIPSLPWHPSSPVYVSLPPSFCSFRFQTLSLFSCVCWWICLLFSFYINFRCICGNRYLYPEFFSTPSRHAFWSVNWKWCLDSLSCTRRACFVEFSGFPSFSASVSVFSPLSSLLAGSSITRYLLDLRSRCLSCHHKKCACVSTHMCT